MRSQLHGFLIKTLYNRIKEQLGLKYNFNYGKV